MHHSIEKDDLFRFKLCIRIFLKFALYIDIFVIFLVQFKINSRSFSKRDKSGKFAMTSSWVNVLVTLVSYNR